MRSALLALLIALSLPPVASDGQTQVHPQTSGAAGTTLFQDDFSKQGNGWTVAKTDYAEFSYADGEYRILLNKPDFNTYSILPKSNPMDVRFDNFTVRAIAP